MATSNAKHDPIRALETYDDETGDLRVVIETPQASRNKYKYDEELGVFTLSGVLPAGAVFPFDFGFVPGTLGEDGDPLDVLVLMDEQAFPGCLIASRPIGVIEAEQSERDGETNRNDRLIAIASAAHDQRNVRELSQLSDNLLGEIEHFFVSYNQIKGKTFKVLRRAGASQAQGLIADGRKRHQQKRKRGAKSKRK